MLRYSEGDEHDGYSVTGMYYHQLWTNTTDIPVRAITEGLVPDRFGTLDPTDGGRAQRASLSVQLSAALGDGAILGQRVLHLQPTASVSMTSRIFWSIRFTAIRRTSSRIAG